MSMSMSMSNSNSNNAPSHPCPLCLSTTVSFFVQSRPSLGSKNYYKCEQCKLIFMDPAFHYNSEQERGRYEEHNNESSSEGYVNFLRRLTDSITPKLASGAKGLDFGCGPSPTLSEIMKRNGFEMENYDLYFFPNEELISADKKYDFITCSECVEHFYNPAKEFQRFDALLKNDTKEGDDDSNDGKSIGWLGIMTGMVTSDDPAAFSNWWYIRDPTHVCFFRQDTMRWIANKYGWEVEFPQKNVTLFHKSSARNSSSSSNNNNSSSSSSSRSRSSNNNNNTITTTTTSTTTTTATAN